MVRKLWEKEIVNKIIFFLSILLHFNDINDNEKDRRITYYQFYGKGWIEWRWRQLVGTTVSQVLTNSTIGIPDIERQSF